jgi:hypothetical protein
MKEMFQLDKKKRVWNPIKVNRLSPRQFKQIIRSQTFLKEKFDSEGNFIKLKARLVAGGHMQDRSLFDDISSPTVSTSAAFMVGAIAAHENRHVVTMDIGGAFLNAVLPDDCEIFVRLGAVESAYLRTITPNYEEFICPDGTIVVKLQKALYGCVQSAKLWYDMLVKYLVSEGFTPNPIDPCVFNKTIRESQCTICLHVDDMMITCADKAALEEFVSKVTSQFDDCVVHRGKVHSYLGMTFDFSTAGKLKLTMEGFISDLLEFCSDITGRATSPATEKLYVVKEDSPALSSDRRERFHSITAKVLYLAKRVRPELLPVCTFLAPWCF